jgi:GT2 family glycosyltransferase
VTYNREPSLREVLHLLRCQDGPPFEVVVVNGPSGDGTAALLAAIPDVKAVECSVANIAAARNVGLAAAAGEIVAFLDDDTYPEPDWLARLVDALTSRPVAGVGGPYRRRSGIDFEHLHLVADRLGGIDRMDVDPSGWYDNPWSDRFLVLPGGNSAYRRSALVEIGGYDEALAYGGEEGDVGIRLRESGHGLSETTEPIVYHQGLANDDRDDQGTVHSRYRYLRSRAYFIRKHALDLHGRGAVEATDRQGVEQFRAERAAAVAEGRLKPAALEGYEPEARQALADAERLWAEGPSSHDAAWFAERRLALVPFRFLALDADKEHICAVVPDVAAAPASLVKALRRRAEAGHVVRLLGAGPERRVTSIDGVWRHLVPTPQPTDLTEELARIHAARRLTTVVFGAGIARGIDVPAGVDVRTSLPEAG